MPDDQDKTKNAATGKGGKADSADGSQIPEYKDPQGRQIFPRQRRQALRRARKLGLDPEDGNHALHMLAERGLDVFAEQDNLLDVAKVQAAEAEKAEKESTAVAASGDEAGMASTAVIPVPDTPLPKKKDKPAKSGKAAPPPPDRELEIARIQHSLIRRRRWRLIALLFRLAVFVFIPTAVVGYYYVNIATDMYETESSFVIQTSENGGGMAGLGGLFGGTGLATSQDSIVVQEYLKSREAFLKLDEDLGYTVHFKDANIDPIQRLPADAGPDEAFAMFKKNVTIGFDSSEGLVRMAVVASTPEASQAFSQALLRYAEIRVDGLTQEARGDQVLEAQKTLAEAEQKMQEAGQRVLDLQKRLNVLSPELELNLQMQLISTLESEAETVRLELAEILDNPGPNQTRADLLQKDLDRRRERIDELRSNLTQTTDQTVSLAGIIAEKGVADAEYATRQAMLQQALQQVETARIEANRQVRYLSLAVAPVAPVEATHPKRLQNTLLAFLFFGAVYIAVSLTVDILREQISV